MLGVAMATPGGLDVTTLFTKASADPVPTVAIAVTALWYLWAVRRLRSRGRSWPWTRTAAFMTAEALLAMSLLSGIDYYDDVSFTDHSIQHIGLSMLAPLFLALSAPVTLLLQSSRRSVQTSVLKVIHSPLGRVLANPLVTWPLYGVSLFVLYFTGLYAYTLDHPVVHDLVHLHLLITGCLFYWPVVAVDPLPYRLNFGIRILYLILAVPFHTILGMALESQTTPIAPGITLADLHAGGALMWIAGEFISLGATIAVFVQWLRAEERQAARTDRVNEEAAARQLALWRASREAAARAASTT